MSPRERIRQIVEKWFLVEPLLFAVWTTHELTINPRIHSIRVQQGRVEYNPAFIDALDGNELEQVLVLEAMRILLKHPYTRRPGNAELAYAASNLTLQEYLETTLPLPRARDVFGCSDFDRQYYEFYYHKLAEQLTSGDARPGVLGLSLMESAGGSGSEQVTPETDERQVGDVASGLPSLLNVYVSPRMSGRENTEAWEPDELRSDQINDRIRAAQETDSWGCIPGRWKERILASLRPPLNYRAILRQFRTTVLSVHRRLTRMKPNRRYGFQYLGSRYDFTTRLLFAVDVSGSMSSSDLALGFSVINRFFKYGIQAIDVVQFDTEIQGEPMTLKRARCHIEVSGRGGTDFTPVIEFLDEHRNYDGAIIFTDGYAPVPPRPKNRRTRLLWLFNHEKTYQRQHEELRALGRAAYLKETETVT
ncbi:MAG: VWA-like domain-containing protein [Gemmataceae bacterium]